MYCLSLATEVPDFHLTQLESWQVLDSIGVQDQLRPGSVELLQKVLTRGKSGIDKRHFMLEEVDKLWGYGPEELNHRFEAEAPVLGERALRKMLKNTGVSPEDLDGLLVCTCTGYLCPGLSSFLAERLEMRSNSILNDLVGLGCGAAIPTMRMADAILQGQPHLKIACLAVEVCSAAFFLDDDPGVLVSACLFGDGAAASLWTGRPEGTLFEAKKFQSLHWPHQRDALRFKNAGGKLKNRLDRSVPSVAGAAVEELLRTLPLGSGEKLISHPGGREVLVAIQEKFPQEDLKPSYEVLRKFGNMSSPSVLFALEEFRRSNPEQDCRLVAFGAGFTAHQCQVTPSPQ